MMTVMFFGLALGGLITGLAQGPLGIAVGLTVIGAAAAIYHPVGIAMVVEGAGGRLGRRLGLNGVFGNLGVALAGLIAGTLADAFGWRWAFFGPALAAAATGLAYAWLAHKNVLSRAALRDEGEETATGTQSTISWAKVLTSLAVATLAAGLIFHATTVALPKVLDQGAGALAGTVSEVGGTLALVYALAAMAQLVVGQLIDRMALRPLLLTLVALQAPALLVLALVKGPTLIAAAAVAMLLIFGVIPLNDTLVARLVRPQWRSRLYGVKYVLSLGVSAVAAPLVSVVHGVTGGFDGLFVVLALVALAAAAALMTIPVATLSRRAAAG